MQQHYLLSVDGGGTHCKLALYTLQGTRLGAGRSGPCNVQLGAEVVAQAIDQALEQALTQAGLDGLPRHALHAGLGLAGMVSAEDKTRLQHYCQGFASAALESDAHTACLGAHDGQDGGIVILGTGSCALALTPPSGAAQFGGWGFALSDQASGAWLGKAALEHTLQTLDQLLEHSALSRAITPQFEQQPLALLRFSQRAQPKDYAVFAPQVFHAAEQGDAVALQLIEQGCGHIERLVKRLQQHGCPRVSLLGGLAVVYQPWLSDSLRAALQPPQGDALHGGRLLAQRAMQHSHHTHHTG